jgi:hypothetical protein
MNEKMAAEWLPSFQPDANYGLNIGKEYNQQLE